MCPPLCNEVNHFDICKAYTTVSNHLNNVISYEKKHALSHWSAKKF